MNKLYILGALALSNVEAYINFASKAVAAGIDLTTVGAQLVGSYTYTISGDCFSSGTATSLGMNNIYHQYYTFKVPKGTATFASYTHIVTAPTANIIFTNSLTAAYSACSHSHLYNWMAQPQIGTASLVAGFGNNVVAYGYAMSGTAITSCAAATIVTSTIATSTKFTGAQYSSVTGTYQPGTATAATTAAIPFYGRVGPGYSYYAKVASVAAVLSQPTAIPAVIGTGGIGVTTAQNAYWDFMQTNVIQGMTQFGRGGGASTAPCGWLVVYAYEAPQANAYQDVDTINVKPDDSDMTINMWTDNSVISAASAFVLTALAGLLF